MRRRSGLLFVAPALVLFGMFVLYPMVTAFSYAFFHWEGTTRGGFAGVQHFVNLFTKAPFRTDLPRALWHNVLFFLGTMLFQNTIGLAVATLLHRRPRTRRVLQTLYAMPYLVSPIVIGYLWTLLLSRRSGRSTSSSRLSGSTPGRCPGSVIPTLPCGWSSSSASGSGSASRAALWRGARGRARGALGGRAGGRRQPPPDLLPDHAAPARAGHRHGQRADVHLRDGGLRAPYAFGGSTGNPAGATDFISLLFYRTAFDSGATDAIGTSSALATLLFVVIFGGALAATAVLRRHDRRITG